MVVVIVVSDIRRGDLERRAQNLDEKYANNVRNFANRLLSKSPEIVYAYIHIIYHYYILL